MRLLGAVSEGSGVPGATRMTKCITRWSSGARRSLAKRCSNRTNCVVLAQNGALSGGGVEIAPGPQRNRPHDRQDG